VEDGCSEPHLTEDIDGNLLSINRWQ